MTFPQRIRDSLPQSASQASPRQPVQTHLKNLLIILGLRLLHLGSNIDIILQITTHMLQRAKTFEKKFCRLAESTLISPEPKQHKDNQINAPRHRTYLISIRVRNRFIVTYRRPSSAARGRTMQRRRALGESSLRWTSRGRHDWCALVRMVSGSWARGLEGQKEGIGCVLTVFSPTSLNSLLVC